MWRHRWKQREKCTRCPRGITQSKHYPWSEKTTPTKNAFFIDPYKPSIPPSTSPPAARPGSSFRKTSRTRPHTQSVHANTHVWMEETPPPKSDIAISQERV